MKPKTAAHEVRTMRLTDEQIRETIAYAKTRPTGLGAADADKLCRLALQNHGPSRFVIFAMWKRMQREQAAV